MNIVLTELDARVIGCLMEKSVTTPDQYPLSLNALINACNQKSSRSPVLALDQGTVQRTARQLADRHLVTIDENFKSRVEKYDQRLCNTPFASVQLAEAEFAVICVLLLRGAQTPGELRTRSGRLCELADNEAVVSVLQQLMEREGGPLVARLPRAQGRQDHEYMHLFYGAIESVAMEDRQDRPVAPRLPRTDRLDALEERIASLEQALEEIRRKSANS